MSDARVGAPTSDHLGSRHDVIGGEWIDGISPARTL